MHIKLKSLYLTFKPQSTLYNQQNKAHQNEPTDKRESNIRADIIASESTEWIRRADGALSRTSILAYPTDGGEPRGYARCATGVLRPHIPIYRSIPWRIIAQDVDLANCDKRGFGYERSPYLVLHLWFLGFFWGGGVCTRQIWQLFFIMTNFSSIDCFLITWLIYQ